MTIYVKTSFSGKDIWLNLHQVGLIVDTGDGCVLIGAFGAECTGLKLPLEVFFQDIEPYLPVINRPVKPASNGNGNGGIKQNKIKEQEDGSKSHN